MLTSVSGKRSFLETDIEAAQHHAQFPEQHAAIGINSYHLNPLVTKINGIDCFFPLPSLPPQDC